MIAMLTNWLHLAETVSRWGARCAGALILLSAAMVGADVLIRKLFGVTLGGADELAGYAFAIGTTWALGFTLLQRGHVRVDALYSRLPMRAAAWLDLLGLVAFAVFMSLLTWRAGAVLADSLAFGSRAATPLATPQWIPQTLGIAGLCLFLFALAPLLPLVAAALLRGDLATVKALSGARSIEEEAAAESTHVADLKPAPGGTV